MWSELPSLFFFPFRGRHGVTDGPLPMLTTSGGEKSVASLFVYVNIRWRESIYQICMQQKAMTVSCIALDTFCYRAFHMFSRRHLADERDDSLAVLLVLAAVSICRDR